jgi:SnoaL-like domain
MHNILCIIGRQFSAHPLGAKNMQPVSDAAMLQAVADRQAITDLVYRYCRSMDRMDAELGYTIWHEGSEADYGEAIYRGSGRGFIDWVCESHRQLDFHSHQVTNIIIELDGDRASSESYVTAALRSTEAGRHMQMTVRGRYLDRWSRRQQRWGIDKRIYVHDFDDVREITQTSIPGWGKRGRSDPSYAVLSPSYGRV